MTTEEETTLIQAHDEMRAYFGNVNISKITQILASGKTEREIGNLIEKVLDIERPLNNGLVREQIPTLAAQ
jgi:hypothetical protein